MEHSNQPEVLSNDYFEAILEGDSKDAGRVISIALAIGMDIPSIYLQIITPAQHQLGVRWERHELSISEEHAATQISLEQMGRLRQAMRPRERLGLRAVVASSDGDSHVIGARMVADLLFLDGWHVHFLGTDAPAEDLASYVQAKQADLVGISVSIQEHFGRTRDAIRAIRKSSPSTKILIGGRAIMESRGEWETLGADGIAESGAHAVTEARRIVGASGHKLSLAQVLKEIGSRINERRKSLKLSQEQLAKMAGLDRAYISSLENGKQNVTLGVILKLSEALDLSLWDLLDREYVLSADC